MVLRDAPISRLVAAEGAFQYPEHMHYFRSYPCLGCVLLFRDFIHIFLELRSAASHILAARGGLPDRRPLALIAAIAPPLAFFAMQQAGQHGPIRHAGRQGADRIVEWLISSASDVHEDGDAPPMRASLNGLTVVYDGATHQVGSGCERCRAWLLSDHLRPLRNA